MSRLAIWAAALFAATMPVSAHAQSAFTTVTRYDVAGRVTGTVAPDPGGSGTVSFAAVRNSYDAAGRLTKVEKGALGTWQNETIAPADWTGFTVFQTLDTAYDAMGHKIKVTMSSGGVAFAVTQYGYDQLGRTVCTAVRMNPAVYGSLPTDACQLWTEGTQGPDRITKTVYDPLGDVLVVQKAYGVTVANGFAATLQQDYATYSYTGNGKPAAMFDANGNKASYTYDGLDRLARWNFPDKTNVGTVSTTDYEEYGYDANANRTSLRKRDGRTFSYSYDALNRVTVKSVPGACVTGYACTTPPAGAVRDVYYSYDLRGLQTDARFDSLAGTDAVINAYDGFGRLTSQTTAMFGVSRIVRYQYDPDGDRVRITHPDGVYFTYDYDGLDRATTVKENGATAIATMSYDAQGRGASETRGMVTTAFEYDPVSRLSKLTDDLPGGTANDITTTLSYNRASQIVGRERSNPTPYAFTGYVSLSRPYTANGLNQYVSSGGATLGYDSNGNLVSDGTTSYSYDAENRLVTTTYGVGATLLYDPLGRLYGFAGSAGKSNVYDGDQRIIDYSADPTVIASRYVTGPGADNPLIWYAGATLTDRRSLQADERGSITSVVDASGTLLGINSYDEYGIPAATNIGRYGYTGQVWVSTVGMWYYKARFYSPTLGRFMQTDPIGYADQNNIYAYVGNDPMNRTDPTGLYDCVGSKGECRAFAALVRGLNTAAASKNISSEKRDMLKREAGTIGTANDGNGLKVNFRNLGETSPGNMILGMAGGDNTLTLNINALTSIGNTLGWRTAFIEGVGAVAHETQHLRDKNFFNLSDVRQRIRVETRGYIVGDTVNQAFGENPLNDRQIQLRAVESCIGSTGTISACQDASRQLYPSAYR